MLQTYWYYFGRTKLLLVYLWMYIIFFKGDVDNILYTNIHSISHFFPLYIFSLHHKSIAYITSILLYMCTHQIRSYFFLSLLREASVRSSRLKWKSVRSFCFGKN